MIKNFIAISRAFYVILPLSALKTSANELKNIIKKGIATPAPIDVTLPTPISILSFLSAYLNSAKKDTTFVPLVFYFFFSNKPKFKLISLSCIRYTLFFFTFLIFGIL
jgi:hypothetical protein